MEQAKLKQILDAHVEWVIDSSTGQRANLRSADLYGADLYGANLYGANLRSANLRSADLYGADLRSANLYGADLYGANLRSADLYGADLRSANLYGANLRSANLSGANLYGADLRGANLYGANLRDADLSGADLSPSSLVPQEGDFTAFKKLEGGKIAKLLIPADAKRVSSLVGRKCRASHAVVLEITYNGVPDPDGEGRSSHNSAFKYKVGETVRADLNDDIRIECASGIHFFITRKEAEKY
jgi:hypothetical protein